MSHDIKALRPSKKSRYTQGYINIDKCKKLFESQRNKPIIYRSSYERKFIYWLETSQEVKKWGSECIGIPYTNLKDGSSHMYYPDFEFETVDGKRIIAEIKPYNQTIPPKNQNCYAWDVWTTNVSKWTAVIEFCKTHGMKFMIFTERTISKI